MKLRVGEIWAEMARRKVQFHANEEWSTIRLWGLFQWGDVRPLWDRGELMTNMQRENRVVWVWPSASAWEEKIRPLIARHSLAELSTMAGW